MKRKGFTLVELLAVIVVLAILITIAVPAVNRVIKYAEKMGLYHYANKVIQQSSVQLALKLDDYLSHGNIEELGVILDLDKLEFDNHGKYEGSIIYNSITDEITVYIHDDKNMIVGLKNNDSRRMEEVVEKYKKTTEVEEKFTKKSMCGENKDSLLLCAYDKPDGTIDFIYNKLKGAAIIGKGDRVKSVHEVIRELAKPGSEDHKAVDNDDEEITSDPIDTVTSIKYQIINSPPAGAVNLSKDLDGADLADIPVYLWFDSSTGTLYFGSSEDRIDIYFSCEDLFQHLSNIKTIDLTMFNFYYVTSIKNMFSYCEKLEHIIAGDENEHWDLFYVSDAKRAFCQCHSLKEINFYDWHTGYLTQLLDMFKGCQSLTTIDVSRWDVSKVQDFSYLFTGSANMVSLDVSNWDTSKATNFDSMFQNMYRLTYLNIARWKTGRVIRMQRMFCGDGVLDDLDVSNWDTRNLEDANLMFNCCYKIQTIDLSNWDISNLRVITQMFGDCKRVKTIIFGRTTNNNTLIKFYERDLGLGVGSLIGGCEALEYIDMSKFEKFPDASSYGYSNYNLKTFLVSSSYTGNTDRGTYTITKVG
ncbi:MAG: BspA family leucine-rich repeat surface protein [Bacilli bacterium]|nr:BspA family leucine-rich repeat surface protein [Bacilli bacterium]